MTYASALQVQDQAAGVRWAVSQGLADPERVGIYGWSYGGYMSAIALARAPDVFKVCILSLCIFLDLTSSKGRCLLWMAIALAQDVLIVRACI